MVDITPLPDVWSALQGTACAAGQAGMCPCGCGLVTLVFLAADGTVVTTFQQTPRDMMKWAGAIVQLSQQNCN